MFRNFQFKTNVVLWEPEDGHERQRDREPTVFHPEGGCPLAFLFFSVCVYRRGRKNCRSLSALQFLVSSATVGRSQERILVLAVAGIGIATGNFFNCSEMTISGLP